MAGIAMAAVYCLALRLDATPCAAQEAGAAYLVKNIHTGSDPRTSRSGRFVTVGDIVFFPADDRDHGRELWRSDGTPSGTWMVKDINPGPGDGITDRLWSPWETAVVGNVLYFFANDGTDDDWRYSRLWRSDGTRDGTVRVDDVPTWWIAAVGDTLMLARGGLHQIDALGKGPVPVAQLPQSEGVWLQVTGDELFFTLHLLDTDDHELWKSDGTTSGTMRVAPINVISPTVGSIEFEASATANLYYFAAVDQSAGIEVWRSDGTEIGTHVLADIRPGSASSLYMGDYSDRPEPLFTAVGDSIFFVASDGVTGYELWKSNGSEGGTARVKDIVAGPGGVLSCRAPDDNPGCDPYRITPASAAGRAYYVFDIPERGLELWSSDGSEAGTQALATISPPGIDPPYVHLVGGDSLFFTVSTWDSPTQLWRSDGSKAGTAIVREFNGIAEVLPHRGGAFLFASDGHSGVQPWWTDGTAKGTITLRDVPLHEAGSYPRDFTDHHGVLLFTASDEDHGRELWRSDATATGTTLVRDIRPGSEDSTPESLVVSNGTLYFTADDGIHGRELWRSDGTTAGTRLVADIAPGSAGSAPHPLADLEAMLFFVAEDGQHVRGLWRTDGSAAGTTLVRRLAPVRPNGSDFYDWEYGRPFAVTAGKLLLFAADGGESGVELWKSDGTALGTQPVRDIAPGSASSFPERLAALNDIVYFSASDADGNGQLWRSDGTASGTFLVTDPSSGSTIRDPRPIAAGRTLFVLSDDYTTPLWARHETEDDMRPIPELTEQGFDAFAVVGDSLFLQAQWRGPIWRIDCAGASVTDVGPFGNSVAALTSVAGRVLFMAGEDSWQDLWEMNMLGASDGWQGTGQLLELPSPASWNRFAFYEYDSPTFTASGSHIFFSGNFGDVGRELWAVPIDIIPQVSAPDCGWPEPTETEAPPEPTPTEPPPTPTPDCDWSGDRSSCAQIVFGSARGRPGETVSIDVHLQWRADPIAAVATRLTFDGPIRVAATAGGRPACRGNDTGNKGAIAFAFNPANCTPGTDCTSVRAVILDFVNLEPIPDGALLYSCKIEIAADAAPGVYILGNPNPEAADPNANKVPISGADGSITVLRSEATDTVGDITSNVSPADASISDGCQIERASQLDPMRTLLLLVPLVVLLGARTRTSRHDPAPESLAAVIPRR